ncbi:unnamed protein product, partial [Ectocarpus fasciculatus]
GHAAVRQQSHSRVARRPHPRQLRQEGGECLLLYRCPRPGGEAGDGGSVELCTRAAGPCGGGRATGGRSGVFQRKQADARRTASRPRLLRAPVRVLCRATGRRGGHVPGRGGGARWEV